MVRDGPHRGEIVKFCVGEEMVRLPEVSLFFRIK